MEIDHCSYLSEIGVIPWLDTLVRHTGRRENPTCGKEKEWTLSLGRYKVTTNYDVTRVLPPPSLPFTSQSGSNYV